MKIRKVPLEPLIEILSDLFDKGADFIDIAGSENSEGEELRDMITITIKPEYMIDKTDDDDIEEIQMSYNSDFDDDDNKSLSDEDIDNLI